MEIRVPRWWMGGVASAAAACFTQPLDTIKVNIFLLQNLMKMKRNFKLNIIVESCVVNWLLFQNYSILNLEYSNTELVS